MRRNTLALGSTDPFRRLALVRALSVVPLLSTSSLSVCRVPCRTGLRRGYPSLGLLTLVEIGAGLGPGDDGGELVSGKLVTWGSGNDTFRFTSVMAGADGKGDRGCGRGEI